MEITVVVYLSLVIAFILLAVAATPARYNIIVNPYYTTVMKKILLSTIVICISVICFAQADPPIPAVTDTLYISMKDKLLFEASYDSSGHVSFRRVKKIADASKTVSITVTYNDAAGTMLKIENPFPKQMYYQAAMYAIKKQEWVETSVIPVGAKLASYETWPYRIDKMRLTGFTLKKE